MLTGKEVMRDMNNIFPDDSNHKSPDLLWKLD